MVLILLHHILVDTNEVVLLRPLMVLHSVTHDLEKDDYLGVGHVEDTVLGDHGAVLKSVKVAVVVLHGDLRRIDATLLLVADGSFALDDWQGGKLGLLLLLDVLQNEHELLVVEFVMVVGVELFHQVNDFSFLPSKVLANHEEAFRTDVTFFVYVKCHEDLRVNLLAGERVNVLVFIDAELLDEHLAE